jgi:hypothetical protein
VEQVKGKLTYTVLRGLGIRNDPRLPDWWIERTDIAGLLDRKCTSPAPQKKCNIVMAMCILSNWCSKVEITEKLATQK